MKKNDIPRKSLRTILMLWFLLFSIAPLAFVTGYSLVKYEQALDQELGHRLSANWREIDAILHDFEHALINDSRQLANDKQLAYLVASNQYPQAREWIHNWLKNHYAHHVWIWSSDGQLEIALYRNHEGQIQRLEKMENGDVYLSDLKSLQRKDVLLDVDVRVNTKTKKSPGLVELMVFTAMKSRQGKNVGYIQQVISVDEYFLNSLKNRLGIELVFYRPEQDKMVATQSDLQALPTSFFSPHAESGQSFDLILKEEPYRFIVDQLKWGDTVLNVALGASKKMATAVLRNVNYTFFSVLATMIGFLIVLSVVTSRLLLRPLYAILDAIRNLDLEKDLISLPVHNETELGLLAISFNEMAERTYNSQKALKSKIRELETANLEIKETQAKLVHAAKMASLGQLVAGVAHELNNPIGFIYSNLGVLSDYIQKLMNLIQVAEKKPHQLDKIKREIDYPYLVKDIPKLIGSCEDGARRTRDIVLGLRNFSRLEEAQAKEVDLHEGLESTLQLLSGELKNRIKIHREYEDLPKITCYASQINQVFMNILSNAAQSIKGSGDITIRTWRQGRGKVAISIKDSGSGMDAATMDKIFDPFFTTKATGLGTGLGLSISYGVIQKHGGEITVDSKKGKGTEFTITLPLQAKIA